VGEIETAHVDQRQPGIAGTLHAAMSAVPAYPIAQRVEQPGPTAVTAFQGYDEHVLDELRSSRMPIPGPRLAYTVGTLAVKANDCYATIDARRLGITCGKIAL
jgi:hypothetical protein